MPVYVSMCVASQPLVVQFPWPSAYKAAIMSPFQRTQGLTFCHIELPRHTSDIGPRLHKEGRGGRRGQRGEGEGGEVRGGGGGGGGGRGTRLDHGYIHK